MVMPFPRGRGRWAALAFLPLLLALFPRVFLLGEVFYDRDLHVDFFPQAEAFVRAVFASSWPLWDSTVSFGQPLLADPSAQVLYPPHWLNLLLSPWRYYVVFVLAHVLFTAEGARRLGMRLGLSPLAALLAGALWAASGPLQSLVSAWHHFAGAAWMPWVLLAASCALEEPAPRRLRLWAVAQGAQLLAGSAEMAALTLALTGLAAVGMPSPAPRLSRLRGAATALGLAIALAAAVWIPAAELASHSARRGLPEASRTLWSLHPARLFEVASPVRWHESGGPPAPLRLPQEPTPPFLPSVYLGVVALILAAAGLSRPGPHRFWLAAAATGAGFVALGPHTPVYGTLVALLPPLGFFRYPTKAWPAVGLAIGLLAAFGWDALRAGPGERRERWLRSLLGAVPLLVSAVALWLTLKAGPVGPGAIDPRLRATLGLGLGVLAYVAVAWGGPRLAPILGLLAVADLAGAHHDLNKTTTADLLALWPPYVKVLRTSRSLTALRLRLHGHPGPCRPLPRTRALRARQRSARPGPRAFSSPLPAALPFSAHGRPVGHRRQLRPRRATPLSRLPLAAGAGVARRGRDGRPPPAPPGRSGRRTSPRSTGAGSRISGSRRSCPPSFPRSSSCSPFRGTGPGPMQ